MDKLTPERALELLGGGPAGRRNGHDLLSGRASRDGVTLTIRPRRGWSWYQRGEREERAARPGSRLISTAAVLLTGLGIGLLAVSYAAQYRYVLTERHQSAASVIEAGALDLGLIIFSLLALGLARAGLAARVERGLIMACAAGSALMNFAPAQASSWRSVLAWCMPPVFLAVVVDRVVVVVRRHVLGMREGRSPWLAAGTGLARAARLAGLAALYGLRLVLAPASTCVGARRAILAATPLPSAAGPATAIEPPRRKKAGDQKPEGRRGKSAGGGTKTAWLLALARQRHGDLSAIPLDQVSRIATALAPEAGLHPASARTALLSAVRAAVPAGEGDAR